MLQALFISLADKVLAAYLSQHPMSSILASFKGKVLAVECTDLPLAIEIEVCDRLRLQTYQGQSVECRISGRFSDLQRLTTPALLPELIKSGAITLEGDLQLASRIADELRDTHFDREEWLSQWLGDVPAHMLNTLGNKLMAWANTRRQTMTHDVEEYLQDEIKWLPASAELRQFSHQVASLDTRCQQLAQRIKALTS
ncbi:SCP2 sterol-binding domain-containing protein [Neiella marina]|uniref:SCP2 sterol-binding domain-containing protein n=1 Tax=Neiella holothuriorum TaxID=2870530 RepID=A0ABS7EC78_9GAMM|nr:SCP2 sterol-binding domain-containing protein [Neiella holothuriorum]MBW8189933.1 SCP2 sterol-binding domain-containing protein [Neiella holothuriorum]